MTQTRPIPEERMAPAPPDGAVWRAIRWIHKRRPLLTAVFVLAVVAFALGDPMPPLRLLPPEGPLGWVVWALVAGGVKVRIWGSGNLRKNQEITRTGVYQLVRHPLYCGSLAVFLAFFLSVGNPVLGLALFLAMVVLVYYPTMMDEEAYLLSAFPEQTAGWERLPRLVPNPLRLPVALRTDRFSVGAAYRNLGLRSLWVFPVLPLFLELLRWVEAR